MIEWHLRAIGLLMLLIAGVHAFFPRWFRWREELNRLSLLNRQIFVVHTLFVVLILVLVGLLLLFHAGTILRSGELGRVIYLGLGVFWAARLAVQLWYYDRTLWQGDTAKTSLRIIVSGLCVYFATVFVWASFATVVG
ncbi:MAG: hypothetical protein K2Y21_16415 [Phycisphaerales bacterium]|nr:hypothetical protein [Phycisphaerales bacterium]